MKVRDLSRSMLYTCRDCGHSFEIPIVLNAAQRLAATLLQLLDEKES